MRRVLLLSCCFCLYGLARPAPAADSGAHRFPTRGVVFVADGSGDLSATSRNLEMLVASANLRFRVERVAWSHGPCRPMSDLMNHDRHLAHGEQLAAAILRHRQTAPAAPIFLVGHSAGAAVILAAAESLPPGCVERIVLLAPAVSASYDLRPALRCSRQGIDSFYSKHDPILSTFLLVLGTADRRWEAAAGWQGFAEQADWKGNERLSCKLRQHCWSSGLSKTGYCGGHYDCRCLGHLRERVVPLLTASSEPAYACTWPDDAPATVQVTRP